MVRCPRRRREGRERVERIASRHTVECLGGDRRSDAVEHLQHAKAGHAISDVLRPAQDREHVFDVRRLDEFEPAKLDERDVAPVELDLEHGAVARGPEQHRLVLERLPRLAILEDGLGDAVGLRDVVGDRDQRRPRAAGALGAQVLGEALARKVDDGVRGGEDRRRRAIVLLERDDARRRREELWKIEDVAHARGAKSVDRLGIVADDGQAVAVRLEAEQDRWPAAHWCPGIRRPAHDRTAPRPRAASSGTRINSAQ